MYMGEFVFVFVLFLYCFVFYKINYFVHYMNIYFKVVSNLCESVIRSLRFIQAEINRH